MSQHDSAGRAPIGEANAIAVIGAGIIGLSVAWNLVRRGMRVKVYDPNPPGSGCSAGSAGAISPGSVVPLAMPGLLGSVPGMLLDPGSALHIPAGYWLKALPWLTAFVAQARPSRVRRISAALAELYRPALQHHCCLLTEIGARNLLCTTGQLHLYRDRKQLAASRREWAVRKSHGVVCDVVDRGGVLDLEPQIGDAYQIGVFLANAGMSVNPRRQAEAIAEALTRAGVEFVRERVTDLSFVGRQVDGLATAVATYRHGRIVVSAGAWSAALLRPAGYRVPLETQRGYHVDFRESGIQLTRPIVPADRKVFITPLETGLRVAGTVEMAGLDSPPSQKRANLLHADLKAVLPSARTAHPDPYWMGHRPCLPDSMPAIGESERWGGLYFAFGHGHLGLSASAVTGSVVAKIIAGEPPPLDLTPFRLERF